MTNNLDELRKTAEAATQADWYALRVGIRDEKEWVVDSHPTFICSMQIDGERAKSDAEFIATFDPTTVLALLSRLEQAEQAVARVREMATELRDTPASPESPKYARLLIEGAQAAGADMLHALDGDGRRLADDALGGGQDG